MAQVQAHHAMTSHMQQQAIPMNSVGMQHMHMGHTQPGDVEYMHGQGSGMYYPNYLMYEHEHMGWYGHVEHDGIPGGETAVAGLGVDNALASHDGAWVSVC